MRTIRTIKFNRLGYFVRLFHDFQSINQSINVRTWPNEASMYVTFDYMSSAVGNLELGNLKIKIYDYAICTYGYLFGFLSVLGEDNFLSVRRYRTRSKDFPS